MHCSHGPICGHQFSPLVSFVPLWQTQNKAKQDTRESNLMKIRVFLDSSFRMYLFIVVEKVCGLRWLCPWWRELAAWIVVPEHMRKQRLGKELETVSLENLSPGASFFYICQNLKDSMASQNNATSQRPSFQTSVYGRKCHNQTIWLLQFICILNVIAVKLLPRLYKSTK